MFSKILIKLVDEAIVPAILLIVTRVVSVIFISNYFKIDATISASGFVFSETNDYVLVNSYSTIAMIAVIAVGLLYVLLKSYFTHSTHVTPSLSAKLFTLRVSSFIQTSFDIYSQGAIWLSYLFLLTIVSGILSFFGFLYIWVFITAVVLSIVATYFFVLDVEDEVFASPSDKSLSIEEEIVLELKGLEDE